MGNNVRRITKQKWYRDDVSLKRRVNNNTIEYYYVDADGEHIVRATELAKSHIKRHTNKSTARKWNFNASSFNNCADNFVYKNLKEHEISCLSQVYKFQGFVTNKTKSKVEMDVIYTICNNKNLKKKLNLKVNKKNNECYVKCYAQRITQGDAELIEQQDNFLKKLNSLLFKSVRPFADKKYPEKLTFNEFDKKIRTYINDNNVKALFPENSIVSFLDSKLKKTTANQKAKTNNDYLHYYYLELLSSNSDADLVSKYEREFFNTINWFKNKKYEQNKNYNVRSGLPGKTDRAKVLENRIYGSTSKFDVTQMYQNPITAERMKLLSDLDKNTLDSLVIAVTNLFKLDLLQTKIIENTNVVNQLSVQKIIELQKKHYKNIVTPNITNLLDGNKDDEKRQLMKMFNTYLKGRYNKTCTEFKKQNLTPTYLKDIYNPKKITDKFKRSLDHKLNLLHISSIRTTAETSKDLEYNKMIQTYSLKLIDKIDYCSKLPISDKSRVADIFYDNMYNRKPNTYETSLTYEVDFFPVVTYGKEAQKFHDSLRTLSTLRDEVLHNKLSLSFLTQNSFSDAEDDIEYLNKNITELIDLKFHSTNVYKFFSASDVNCLFKKMLKNTKLDLFTTNTYLPRFSKIFNKLYYDDSFDLISAVKEDTLLDEEKKGALRFFLQFIYYYGFSKEKIIIGGLSLEDYVVQNQVISSIKGNSKKENYELINAINIEFQEYIKALEIDFKVLADFSKENSTGTLKILQDIDVEHVEYCGGNLLFNLSYYLDTKRLSSLIHDTKKLVQGLEAINTLSAHDKNILISNIKMMTLLLEFKDRIKNISYEQIVNDCNNSLSNSQVIGDYLSLIISEEDAKHFGKVQARIEKIKARFDDKIRSYKEAVELVNKTDGSTYQVSVIQNQGLYESGEHTIIHSGIEYYQKYNLSEMLKSLVQNNTTLTLTDKDLRNYEALNQEITDIEQKENAFINAFNKEIKNTQSPKLKIVIATEFKQKEEYKEICENNIKKNTYHYLKNKIKFNHLRYVNSFIDDVLARLNSFMMYWERDANLIIDKYISDNGESVIADVKLFEKTYAISRKRYIEENHQIVIDKLLVKHVNFKSGNINAYDIRNFVSHNNYYVPKGAQRYSLLELINHVHNIMGYNLKYQKAVLDVFNNILNKYKVSNDNNPKNELPLKYYNGKIVTNDAFFIPRKHKYFDELNLNSSEYVSHLKSVLEFK